MTSAGSGTKTYTASVVLMLAAEGLIDLDAVLETYVPGVVNGDVATIADLLGMRYGDLRDVSANQGFNDRFDADPDLQLVDEDMLAVLAEAPGPDFAPGEKVVYCDSNYLLLGMVIEVVTASPQARSSRHESSSRSGCGRRPSRRTS